MINASWSVLVAVIFTGYMMANSTPQAICPRGEWVSFRLADHAVGVANMDRLEESIVERVERV